MSALNHFFLSPPLSFIIFLLCIVQFGFGGYAVLLKWSQSDSLKPLIFSFYRDAVASPLLLIAAYLIEGLPYPVKTDIPIFIVLGLTMFGNQFGNILGNYYTSANIASIFQPAIPVFTALLAIATRIEAPPNLRTLIGCSKLFGILLATGGAIVMIVSAPSKSSSTSHDSGESLLGYLFLLGNCISMAAYVLIQKKYIFNPAVVTQTQTYTTIPTNGTTTITTRETYPLSRWAKTPISMTAYSYIACSLLMGMSSLYYVVLDRSVFIISGKAVGVLMYAAFISSALCYGLITYANKHITASFVTATWPLQVVVSIILSYFVLHDDLMWQQYIGASMIIGGLAAVTWSNHAESTSKFHPLQDTVDVTEDEESPSHDDVAAPIIHRSTPHRKSDSHKQPLVVNNHVAN